MKTIYRYLFLLPLLSACSAEESYMTPPVDEGVEVVFSAKRPPVTREGEIVSLPSVLIYSKKSDGLFTLSAEKNTGWQTDGQNKDSYLNSIILPSGSYRFLLAGGFTKEPTDDQFFFSSAEVSPPSKSVYDKDYFFSFPHEVKNGKVILKTCHTDLFVDSNESGFEPNDKEYSLVVGNRFTAKRKITRLQGRLDVLARRGVRNAAGVLVPVLEGADNKLAMENALIKIESIRVKVDDAGSRCHVDGFRFSTPGSYSFAIQEKGASYAFKAFDANLFVADLNNTQASDYLLYQHSAYCKGPLLFPAPGDAKVTVTVEVDYKEILPTKTITQELLLERNKVSLMVLWLLNEEIGVDIEVSDANLEYSDKTEGDDGFWN